MISARRGPAYAAPAMGRMGKATMSRYDGKKVKAVFGGKGFYIALAVCLLAAGIVGYYTLLRPQAPAEPAASPNTAVPDERDNAWVAPTVTPEENVPAAPPAEETPISDPQDLLPQVMSPLDGTTVTVFSVTELMYDETMADWRTHNGIDIQAAEGDSVRTAASGTVLSVKDDELMGTTVVIQHGGGYTTQYSCLQKDPPVQEGDQVAAGDIIGLVGSTASAEGSMGPHLHFSVSKDGKLIDPADYVNCPQGPAEGVISPAGPVGLAPKKADARRRPPFLLCRGISHDQSCFLRGRTTTAAASRAETVSSMTHRVTELASPVLTPG